MKTICPRVGTECLQHECEFYDPIPATPDKFECRDKIRNDMLNDLAAFLNELLRSNEQHRELMTQAYRSAALKAPTPELKRLIGVEG